MANHDEHYCPVAHALDLVGDRWALLVVRELMPGPKRYTDLVDHLPGIGTNLLAPRAPPGRFEFRVGGEIASIVDGEARSGPIDDPDVVVEGDAECVYYLLVDRRVDGVSVEGDRKLLEQLIDATPQP